MRQKTSTVPLSPKHSAHSRHGPQLSFPCTRESIYPHTPDAAFRNTLPTTNNKRNDNTVAIPIYYTRYTMGPRVREDDKIRDRKRLIDQRVGITKMRQDTSTAPLSHKHSAHSRHGPQLSFPCTRETIQPHAPDAAFGNILTEIDNIEQSNINTGNEAVIPSHTTCCTMGPRVREDDKIREKRLGTKASKRQKWRVATKETENLEPHSSKQT